MKRGLALTAALLLGTGLSFGVWALLRLAMIRYAHADPASSEQYASILTSASLHNLRLSLGYDLWLVLPLSILAAFAVGRSGGARTGIGIGIGILTLFLALAMAFYPTLILSGRIASQFTGVLAQSAVFAALTVSVIVLIGLTIRFAEKRSRLQ